MKTKIYISHFLSKSTLHHLFVFPLFPLNLFRISFQMEKEALNSPITSNRAIWYQTHETLPFIPNQFPPLACYITLFPHPYIPTGRLSQEQQKGLL